MSIRLSTFQYLPKDPDGWASGLLHFGDLFTTVQGPNGAGKTPIMKGVMIALGHEVELPPAIRTHCRAAEVALEVEGQRVVITRHLADEYRLTVSEGRAEVVYTTPKEYGGLVFIPPHRYGSCSHQQTETGVRPLPEHCVSSFLGVTKTTVGPLTTGLPDIRISCLTSGRRSFAF